MSRYFIIVVTLFIYLFIACTSSASSKSSSTISAVNLPLSTAGRYIVDKNGKRVRLACVNWYGAHMEEFIVNGLNVQSIDTISQSVSDMGFNCVRMPYSLELFFSNPLITNSSVIAANANLLGMRAMDILDRVIASLTGKNIMVILNNHIGKAMWCCSETDDEGLWYNGNYSENQFFDAWYWFALKYKDNAFVVGADLRNELRTGYNDIKPTWGTGELKSDWSIAAVKAANMVLGVAPHWLILVEGLEYACTLASVKDYPLTLAVPNKLVYSSHDYSWSQSGVKNYDQFKTLMDSKWGFILLNTNEKGSLPAPIWLGEFGTNNISESWWIWMKSYIAERDLDWCYWALDGYQRIGVDESFGILLQDYKTIRDAAKLADLQSLMSVTSINANPSS